MRKRDLFHLADLLTACIAGILEGQKNSQEFSGRETLHAQSSYLRWKSQQHAYSDVLEGIERSLRADSLEPLQQTYESLRTTWLEYNRAGDFNTPGYQNAVGALMSSTLVNNSTIQGELFLSSVD